MIIKGTLVDKANRHSGRRNVWMGGQAMNDNTRITKLEKRVEELEKQVTLLQEHKWEGVAREAEPVPHEHVARKPKTKKTEKEPVDLETLIGKVWLPRIFIFVLLIGVIWGFKAAVEGGYLNEQVRVALGFSAALLLLFLGERESKKLRKTLGHVLLSGAISILILTTFAMHMLYGFIPTGVAFGLNVIWLALGLFFSHRHHSQLLAVLSVIVGVLVPFLVESDSPNILFLVGYEVLLYSVFLVYAMRKGYLALYYTSAILLQLVLAITYLLIGHTRVAYEEQLWAFGALIQHLLLLGTYYRWNSFMKHQMGLLFGSFVFTIIWLQSVFSIDVYGLILVGFFLVYVSLSALYWNNNKDKQPIFVSLATISLMLYFLSAVEHQEWLAPVLMLQGVVATYIGLKTQSKLQLGVSSFVYVIGAFSASYLLIDGIQSVFSVGSFTWFIGLCTLYALNWLVREHQVMLDKLLNRALNLKVINTITFVLLAIGSLIFITNVTYVATENWDLQLRHFTASIIWIIYATVGLLVGVIRQLKPFRVSAMILLFITLVKIVIIDLPDLSVPIRAALFIGLGIVGLGMSRLLYKK